VAQISIACKRTHLGYFNSEHEAARKYDEKANELHRPLNFPNGESAHPERATKSESAVIVGPNTGFTKGPYRKRVSSKLEDGEVEKPKLRKKKTSEQSNISEYEEIGPTGYLNPELIMQMFIEQQSMLRASDERSENSTLLSKDSRVAGILMDLAHRDISNIDSSLAAESPGIPFDFMEQHRRIVRM
jgi:hypothetical protein